MSATVAPLLAFSAIDTVDVDESVGPASDKSPKERDKLIKEFVALKGGDDVIKDILEGNGSTFTMNFKIENLKVLDGNYADAVSSKGISHFKNKDIDLEYFIALEPDSSYSA